MNKKGAFVVIEGLDGSGKSTQAKLLAKKLKNSHSAIYTAEPSKGRIGRFIRGQLLYGEARPSPALEALLFAADRIDHIQNEVEPLLAKGHLVISDRYMYSSLAYQGSTGLSLNWIQEINRYALKPDFALFIDVEPSTVLERIKRKKSIMENFQTQQKVREVYLHFVKAGELIKIDGNKSRKAVAKEVLDRVLASLRKVS